MAQEPITSYLKIKSVTKTFGGLTAVNDFNMALNKGELVSIIGPNGAGKTTLINLIAGAHRVTRGEIIFEGQNLEKMPAHKICTKGIARSFQNLQLFNNMSVVENVMIGRHIWMNVSFFEVMLRLRRVVRREEAAFDTAMQKLAMLGLEGKANELPSSLALKDRMFLCIARALATEPNLLLLDEPVGGLTVEEISQASEKILELQRSGLTILFIEHRMELVRNISERVIVMNFGQKIAEGTFQEIQNDSTVLSAYLGEPKAASYGQG